MHVFSGLISDAMFFFFWKYCRLALEPHEMLKDMLVNKLKIYRVVSKMSSLFTQVVEDIKLKYTTM